MKHNQDDWVYLAGVFDTAGSIGATEVNGHTHVRLTISSPNAARLDALHEHHGIGRVSRASSASGRSAQWAIMSADDIMVFCENVMPYVCEPSRELLRLALEHAYRVGNAGQRMTDQTRSERESIVLQIWHLSGRVA